MKCFNNGRLIINIMRTKKIHVRLYLTISLILKQIRNSLKFKILSNLIFSHYTHTALPLVECSVAKSGSQVSDDPVKTMEENIMIYVQES